MSHIDLLVAMKKNSPTMYTRYRDFKVSKINKRLEELRGLYRDAKEQDDPEAMLFYEKTAAELKKDLKVYEDIDAQSTLI